MKHCAKCDSDKPDLEFALLNSGKRYATCRECKSAAKRTWAIANKSHVAAYKKAYESTHKDKKAACDARCYLRHRERIIGRVASWTKENLEKVRPYQASYQSARRDHVDRATPAWADHDSIVEIYRRAAELKKTDGIERHVDHIVPIRGRNVCGLHVPANLQILTAAENRRKFNHHI